MYIYSAQHDISHTYALWNGLIELFKISITSNAYFLCVGRNLKIHFQPFSIINIFLLTLVIIIMDLLSLFFLYNWNLVPFCIHFPNTPQHLASGNYHFTLRFYEIQLIFHTTCKWDNVVLVFLCLSYFT